MSFTVRIQNLGKLADATVRVGQLTVLAGPNNTGKSFFSKAMYSVFDAMNANPAEIAVNNELIGLRRSLTRANSMAKHWSRVMSIESGQEDAPAPSPMPHLEPMIESVARVATAAASCSLNGNVNGDEGISDLDLPYPDLEQAVIEMEGVFGLLKPELEEWLASKRESQIRRFFGPDYIDIVAKRVSSVRRIGEKERRALVTDGISSKVSEEFSENFQIGTLTDLIGASGGSSVVEIDDVGSFVIGADVDNDLDFKFTHAGLLELQRFSRVIYLESPILWKLKAGLLRLRRDLDSNEVPPAPGYFYDLSDELDRKYRGEAIAQEETQHLAKNIVQGKIVVSETGELLFAETDAPEPRSLSIVSTGVSNLGFLAMLVERKIVDSNSFLFIDEPEVNLHPGWQVEMLRLLVALAREGVHVVIATHSSDIVEHLSAMTKQEPELKELIELNHFSREGGVNPGGEKEFRARMGDILGELTKAFSDSFMMGQEASNKNGESNDETPVR